MSATTQKPMPQSAHNANDTDLPEGWAVAKIADICEPPQYGWTTSANKNGQGLKLLRTTDISGGTVEWSSVPACTDEPDEPQKYLLKSGDIVVSRAGSVGLSFLVKNPPRAVFASYLIRFRPLSPVESEFIALFMKSPEYWSAIAEESAGIAVPNVNASKLKEIALSLPPLPEQKRIVAKVEELLTQVNAARDCVAKVSKILKRFRQSVLAAACSGSLTKDCRRDDEPDRGLPVGWQWLPLDELLPKGGIFDGPFGSNLKTADYTPAGVRVIRMENIGWLSFIASKLTFISEQKYQSLARHTVRAGDIIFSSFIDDEVRTCVLPVLPTKAIAKADCFCIRPDPRLVDCHYLALQLSSQDSYDALHENIHGATRPRVNTTQLRKLSVRVCPMPEQHEIVRRVKALFKLADAIEKRVEAATKRADKLTQAILGKAFRGELVPTEAELARREGRTYEPASLLLERIRTEHAGAEEKPRSRRRSK